MNAAISGHQRSTVAARVRTSGMSASAHQGQHLVGELDDVEVVDDDDGVRQAGADGGPVGGRHVDGDVADVLSPGQGCGGEPGQDVGDGAALDLAEQPAGAECVDEPGVPPVPRQLPLAAVGILFPAGPCRAGSRRCPAPRPRAAVLRRPARRRSGRHPSPSARTDAGHGRPGRPWSRRHVSGARPHWRSLPVSRAPAGICGICSVNDLRGQSASRHHQRRLCQKNSSPRSP